MTFKIFVAACLSVVLGACNASKTRPTPAIAPEETRTRPPSGAAVYSVDSARSELRLLVYRAGPMARFGHNHVILNRAIGGWVDAAGAGQSDGRAAGPSGRAAGPSGLACPESSSFSLRVPVGEFVVDDARARADEGEEFSAEVPEEAKSGTRRNMLSDALLDADRFPTITLTSVGIACEAAGNLVATMTVGVAGHQSTLVVPFALETSPQQISAAGSVALRQSDLGLTPFSALLGALQVQDELIVKFKVVAHAEPPAAGS